MRATIRSSASISTMPNTWAPNASDRWSWTANRSRHSMRRSPTRRNDGYQSRRHAELSDCPHARDGGISTVSNPRVDNLTAVVDVNPVGQHFRYCVPVARTEARQETLVHSACRVFQPRRWSAAARQTSRARRRGLPRRILAAVDQIAVDRHQVDPPPLRLEAFVRGPMRPLSEDRAEVVEPMHGLDVDVEVWPSSQPARRYSNISPGANDATRRWSIFTQSGVVAASSRRLNATNASAMTDHVCAWAAASPARYRASSSAKAASSRRGRTRRPLRSARRRRSRRAEAHR